MSCLLEYFKTHPDFRPASEPVFLDAACSGSETIVRALVDAGFDPALSVVDGLTPLHCLQANATVSFVQYLKSLYKDSLC